jgi:hypothetical protein
VKNPTPCQCGSGMFCFLRIVFGGEVFLACKRCATWSLLQVPGVWETVAKREEGAQ